MKIRTDFVTNSSSSSFVIAYRESSNPLHNTLVKLVIDTNSHYDTSVAHVITNKEALDKKFLSWFGCSTDTILDVIRRNSDVRSEYNHCVDYLKKGYKIICKSIGYGDGTLQDLIRILATDNDDFVMMGDEYED